MADDADRTAERMEIEERLSKPEPYEIRFERGICMDCGEDSVIVGGVCGPCRADEERRKRAW